MIYAYYTLLYYLLVNSKFKKLTLKILLIVNLGILISVSWNDICRNYKVYLIEYLNIKVESIKDHWMRVAGWVFGLSGSGWWRVYWWGGLRSNWVEDHNFAAVTCSGSTNCLGKCALYCLDAGGWIREEFYFLITQIHCDNTNENNLWLNTYLIHILLWGLISWMVFCLCVLANDE